MLVQWIIISLIILGSFSALVLSRICYKLRKISTLISIAICICLVFLYNVQVHFVNDTQWTITVLWHNRVVFYLLILVSLYQFIMTVVCKRYYKWDAINYTSATILLLSVFPWYFLGCIAMSIPLLKL